MTAWLWVIGITAVFWPIIVGVYVSYVRQRHCDNVALYGENRRVAELRENRLRDEVAQLQSTLEKQDALIAALWQSQLGFHRPEAYGALELHEYLGVRPEWHPFEEKYTGSAQSLRRCQPYPWQKHAEELYFCE